MAGRRYIGKTPLFELTPGTCNKHIPTGLEEMSQRCKNCSSSGGWGNGRAVAQAIKRYGRPQKLEPSLAGQILLLLSSIKAKIGGWPSLNPPQPEPGY